MSIFNSLDASDFDAQSTSDLKRVLSHESLSMPDSFSVLTNFIPKIVTSINEGISFLKARIAGEGTAGASGFREAMTDVDKYTVNKDFIEYRQVLMTVPEGFSGHLLDYLKALQDIAFKHIKDTHKSLEEYRVTLGSVLNSPDFRKNLQLHNRFVNDIEKSVTDSKAVIAKFITPTRMTSRQKIGTVITRFSEMNPIIAEATRLMEFQNSYDYRRLNNQVAEICQFLDLIKKGIDDKEIENLSPAMVRNIADGAFEIAKLVEFVAIYSYHTENALACVNNLVEQIKSWK